MVPNLPTTDTAFTSLKKNFVLKQFLVVAFLLFGWCQNVNAQVSAYGVAQLQDAAYSTLSTGTYITPPTTSQNDIALYNVVLPFSFTFNGSLYPTGTVLKASENGYLTFGATLPSLTSYTPISSNTAYSGAISLYGANLQIPNVTLNGIRVLNTGSSGSQIFKIEWIVRRVIGTETTNMLFQLWLFETSNLIEFHYNIFAPTLGAIQGEVGLRGNNNSDYLNLDYSVIANWPGIAPSPLGVMPTGTSNNVTVVTRNLAAKIETTSNRLFRFTPVTCFAPTGLNVPFASITSSTATLNWNAASPAPTLGYEYYVTTSATAPTSGTTPTGSVAAGVLTASLTGLTAGSLQYVYVRSKCSGVDTSSWSAAYNFSTPCNPTNVPFTESFTNGVTTNTIAPYFGVLPTCTTQQNLSAGNPWVTTYADTYYPDANMDEYVLMYHNPTGNSNAANVWFYSQGINLVGGTTYSFSYVYGGTASPSTVTNKMRVGYFSAPINTSLVGILDDHPNIKGSPFPGSVTFTPATTGVYYMGLNAYSVPYQGQLYVDDLAVNLSVCLKSTAVSVSSISATTALLSWTAPTPAPASGYAYYFSTSSTAPTNGTVASGFTAAGVNSVTLTGLTGSTNYYFWVRTRCPGGEFGEWVALNNTGSPFFTTLVPPPAYCTPSGAGFAQDPQGITNVTMGTINNTTGIEANNYGNYSSLITNVAQGATVACNITYATGFTYDTNIWVDWNNNGVFAPAELVYQGNSAGASPTTLNASFVVPAGQPLGPVRLRIGGIDFGPFTDPCRNGNYQAFEDYTINVIVAPPALTISSTSSNQCAGTNSPLITITTPLSNYNTYSWSPSTGVTGTAATGYTINSNTTLTYTLTGVQTSSPFSTNSVNYTYTANPLPTTITIATPSGTTVCPSGGTPVALNTSGGLVSGVPLLQEGFNGSTNSWTVAGSGSGSPVGNFTLRPNGYTVPLGAMNSNDNTQYYEANSDAPGSGTTLTTTLTSPAFSTVGYTNLSLSFWHLYRVFTGDTAKVQISIDGVTYVDLAVYNSNQGTLPNFTFVPSINITAYINQPTVTIRFRYDATWDWFWAVDNVLVSGTAGTSIVWNTQSTPVANGTVVPGLYSSYTNATTNTPYIAGSNFANVLGLPSATTTYIASASTVSPVCATSTPVTVTVDSSLGGVASTGQTICYGSPNDLTLTGYTGAITSWQSANNAAFTFSLITIPSSGSATLTSAQMGALTFDKYYRAVVTNGSCTYYSTTVHITFNSTNWDGSSWSNGNPSSTKAAIFDDLYTSTGDLNACSVIISNGDVVFGNGTTQVHNLIVENAVDTSGGTLTINTNSSLVQNVNVVNGAGVYNGGNVGNIVYKRNTAAPGVRLYDYTYWSSPVYIQTLVGLSPGTLSDKYFIFNTTINNWQSVPSFNTMIPGTGYIIRAPQTYSPTVPANFTGIFTGVPNNGRITTNVVVGSGTVNLIGNPYPSAIDIDYFLRDSFNDAKIGGTIYLWTHNTPVTGNLYVASDYATYNLTGGVGTGSGSAASGTNNTVPTGKVAAGQSFFIEGSIAASTQVVQFTNSMRVAGSNNQFYRSATAVNSNPSIYSVMERNRIWLELFNNEGAYKQTMVGYIENATNNFDDGFDGPLFDVGNTVSLYSVLNTEKLAIQGRALPFDTADIVPLGYRSNVAGDFSIKLSDFDGFFSSTAVYLEDLLLHVVHDLKESDYIFSTNVGTFDGRFQLRYTNGALGTNNPVFNDNSVVVFKNAANDIVINSSNTVMKEIKVFDIRGRQLFSKAGVNANEFKISNLNSSEQLLIVSITSEDGKIVNKKIVF